MRAGIRVSELPRTFQDAIVVARRLRLRYLWIDSLCIMQDSHEDWAHESSLMRDVYANSSCNISATWSSNSDDGCFVERDPSMFLPYKLTTGLNGEASTHRLLDANMWENQITNAPLNRRGWVLQERMCAPRVLHFGADQIFWECTERVAAEITPMFNQKGEPFTKSPFKTKEFWCLFQKTPKWPSGNISRDFLHDTWRSIVISYMQCQLTKPEDKLVALSGITRLILEKVGADYLAGLWRDELSDGLLWRVENCQQADFSPSTRPSVYRAPSWSWASVDARLSTDPLPDIIGKPKSMIVIEEASVQCVTDDPTGQVCGGHIRLRGAIFNAEYERDYDNSWLWWIRECGKDIEVRGELQMDTPSPFNVFQWQRCTFLLVSQSSTRTALYFEGLLLEHVSQSDERFTRLGYFQIEVRRYSDRDLHPIFDFFGLEVDVKSGFAEVVDQSCMKTIVII